MIEKNTLYEFGYSIEQDDNDTLRLWFPDVPEAHGFCLTQKEAARRASEVLEVGLSFYIEGWRPLPRPLITKAQYLVRPSLDGILKLAIFDTAMLRKLSRLDLANLLNLNPAQVDHLLDLTSQSRTYQLELALAVLGKKMNTQLIDI